MTVKPEKDVVSASGQKMPYTAPVLVTWGTLRDITQSVGGIGAPDGQQTKNAKKTR
jgi:hypothetical protein